MQPPKQLHDASLNLVYLKKSAYLPAFFAFSSKFIGSTKLTVPQPPLLHQALAQFVDD